MLAIRSYDQCTCTSSGRPLYNVFVALHPTSLDQPAYDAFAVQLNPGSAAAPYFSKPRIGDVFAVRGTPQPDREINGKVVRAVNAVYAPFWTRPSHRLDLL